MSNPKSRWRTERVPKARRPRAGDGGVLPNADKTAAITHIVTKRSWETKMC